MIAHNGHDILSTARRATAGGLSVLPIRADGSKAPAVASWEQFQNRIATDGELRSMFRNGVGIGVVAGKVSGNLEILDIDKFELFEPFAAEVEILAPGLIGRLTQNRTPKGMHLGYRCDTIEGNQKLAQYPVWNEEHQRHEPKTSFETRGQGGYIVAPGSPAECHDTGRLYEHVGGPELVDAPRITPEERAILFQVARSFNEWVPPVQNPKTSGDSAGSEDDGDGVRPGDDYNARATWEQVLEPHGWKKLRSCAGKDLWQRPGKEGIGWSATTGIKSKDGNDLLCVFSSNAYPFEGATPGHQCSTYSKFAAFALLHYSGDYSEAGKALVALGYGTPAAKKSETTVSRSGLPKIDTSIDDLPKLTGQAWDALERANEPPKLFRYAGIPSRIESGDLGEPVIKEIGLDHMTHHLARAAEWVKQKKSGDEFAEVPASPPQRVIKDVLATPDMGLPILTRIVEAPVFAPDGSLQIEPGYHPASRTFFAPRAGFAVPEVSVAPTAEEIRRARDLLCGDLLGDFPFVSNSEKAHTLGLMLLPAARDLIAGPTPLHLVEKPSPGTGATLLCDLVALAPTGRPIPSMTEGRDEDEWRKRITAKLYSGSQFVFIDNLRGRLDSAAVASAITSPMWEDRYLGVTRMIRVPVRSIWIASGNNPAISSEIARRTVRIRLDAKQDRPWLRAGFRHPDLRQWATDHRSDLLWATLTMIQAWLAAGCPPGEASLGMFESWSKTIGGILAVADVEGFLGNLDEFYEESDAEGGVWRSFLIVWWEKYGAADIKAAKLFELCTREGEEVPLPLGDGNEQSRKVRFGKLLSQMRDRIFEVELPDGRQRLKIQRGEQRQRTYEWKLEKVGGMESKDSGECVSTGEYFPPYYAGARTHAHTREHGDGVENTHETHDTHGDGEDEVFEWKE